MPGSVRFSKLCVPVGAVEWLETRQLLAFAVDPAFGPAGGFAYLDPQNLPVQLLSLAPISDGTFLVGGSIGKGTSKKSLLLRANADGSLDSTFNNGAGRLIINPSSTAAGITAIKQRSDGSFMVAGGNTVARVTAAGRLDSTFGGGDGVVPVASPTVAFDSSGAFYVADATTIKRFTTGGTLDTGWSTGGSFNYRNAAALKSFFAETNTPDRRIAVNPAGRVMMALDGAIDESGSGPGKIGLFRLNATGKLDTGFSSDGVTFADFGGDTHRLAGFAVLPDSRSMILLDEDDGIASIFAFGGKGSPAATPAADAGMLRLDQPFEPAGLYALPDTQTLLLGSSIDEEGNLFSSAIRLTGAFELDTSFSNAGAIATLHQASAESADTGEPATAAAQLADGSIAVITQRVGDDVIVRLTDEAPVGTTVELVDRRLVIRGAATADNIRITPAGRGVRVVANGQTYAFDARRPIALDIDLGAGDDALTIDEGLATISTSLVGGAGNDAMLIFDAGADGTPRRVDGGEGNDNLKIAAGASIVFGGAGADSLFGSTGDDALFGGDDNDLVVGGAGDDYLEGNTGHDTLDGSAGSDRLIGHQGSDVLIGGKGDDTIYGMSGNDILSGGIGADYLDAGAGDDRLETKDAAIDKLFGGGDSDTSLSDVTDLLDGIETVTN